MAAEEQERTDRALRRQAIVVGERSAAESTATYACHFIINLEQEDKYMTHHKHDSHYHQHGSDKGFELETPLHTSAAITREQRECMISEAAYYMAEHRHFQGGDPIHDWLQAQMEIDSKIKSASH